MNHRREPELFGETAAGRSKPPHETRAFLGRTPPRALASDAFAADLLRRALARPVVVDEWCGCYSEYFLG